MQNVDGCDSIVLMNLYVLPSYDDSISVSICEGETYSFLGVELSNPGLYYDSLQTIFGCDSTIVLDLRVNPSYSDTLSVTIDEGSTCYFYGRDLVESGTYTEYLVTINGCDSNIVLNLNVVEPTSSLYDLSDNLQISLYPNPTIGDAVLTIPNLQTDALVYLIDERGIVVKLMSMSAFQERLYIKTDGQQSGAYSVKIISAGINVTKKLIIQ